MFKMLPDDVKRKCQQILTVYVCACVYYCVSVCVCMYVCARVHVHVYAYVYVCMWCNVM